MLGDLESIRVLPPADRPTPETVLARTKIAEEGTKCVWSHDRFHPVGKPSVVFFKMKNMFFC